MSSAASITSAAAAARQLNVAPPRGYQDVEKVYPVNISNYYLQLIQTPDDPIWRQCMPSGEELATDDFSNDGLGEAALSPAPRIIHRYPDRAALLATGRCAVRCRFCFRKRVWRDGNTLPDISAEELRNACDYLKRQPKIREVLISGGDPLMLPPPQIATILDGLRALENIEVIRVATRLPVVDPERISDELISLLGPCPGLWLMTHFNHPREVTPAATACCKKFISAGIPVLNQTVLLKGVNDNVETLENLFRQLIAIQVKPHYLFHVDPVKGVRHFATGIDAGLDILRQFRGRLSSLATPTFAIDLPEGNGKVALQPEYRIKGKFPSFDGKSFISYP